MPMSGPASTTGAALHTGGVLVMSQSLLVQSAATLQALVSAHLVVQEPPQSMSVSSPFLTLSVQLALVQVSLVASHTRLTQSVLILHALSSPQAGQVPPPQSTSVSLPFFLLSLQVGLGMSVLISLPASFPASRPASAPARSLFAPPSVCPPCNDSKS